MQRKSLTMVLVVSGFIILNHCSDHLISSNNSPELPDNPYPANNARNRSVNVYLHWVCTDPDGDSLSYSIYFGTSINPSLVESHYTGTTYDPGTLGYGRTYYWKIIAHDDQGNKSAGEIWQFKTVDFVLIPVPAGEYTSGEDDETAYLDYDFAIMKYEVTNDQYLAFLEEALADDKITVSSLTVEGYYEGDEYYNAGEYEFLNLDANDCRILWDGSEFSIASGYERHPVTEVTWFGARGFARHHDMNLPSEEEWEKAARGNTGWDFPWGDDPPDCQLVNYQACGLSTVPVGEKSGVSPYGVYDMAGNVYEWTRTFCTPFYPYYVERGGGWSTDGDHLETWYRYCSNHPRGGYSFVGFRLVSLPEEM